jgi:hypothetical protein
VETDTPTLNKMQLNAISRRLSPTTLDATSTDIRYINRALDYVKRYVVDLVALCKIIYQIQNVECLKQRLSNCGPWTTRGPRQFARRPRRTAGCFGRKSIAKIEVQSLLGYTARTSETSVDIDLTTRQYIPEDSKLHSRSRENLKSHITKIVSNT